MVLFKVFATSVNFFISEISFLVKLIAFLYLHDLVTIYFRMIFVVFVISLFLYERPYI